MVVINTLRIQSKIRVLSKDAMSVYMYGYYRLGRARMNGLVSLRSEFLIFI